MSLPEVTYRVARAAHQQRVRLRAARTRYWPDDGALWTGLGRSGSPDWPAWADEQRRATRRLCVDAHARDGFIARYPDEAERIIDDAARVAGGTLDLYGHKIVHIPSPPLWHRDPVTGRMWPTTSFSDDIDYRSGGAKGIWEPARHQQLVPIAQAYWLAPDDRWSAALETQLSSWFDQNPYFRGIHWCSGLEQGLRLASWLWVQAFAAGAVRQPSIWREWTRAIIASADGIAGRLSRFSSANNHLIGEAAGLVFASVLVPEWHEAGRWNRTGWNILEEEIARQILPDGVTAEQALHYEGFVIDFFHLLLATAAPAASVRATIMERLVRAGEFIALAANMSGELPLIGDDDGGRAWSVSRRGPSVSARLAVISTWAQRADLKPAGPLPVEAWWLLGEEGAERYDALSRAVPAASCRAFPHGGYYILRHAPEPVVIFDCGPLGYLSLAAHGHADCLSLCLSVKGEWLLVDPGTYVYHEEQEWRRWFRGTAAHNTLTIEGLDQSEQTGHTMWGRRANGSLRAFFCDEHLAWVEGDHDGYRHLKPPRTHHRAVALGQPGYLLVIDRVIGGPCDVSINWQFAPSLRVTRADRQRLVIERSCHPDVTHRYQAQLLFDADVTIHYGEDEPFGGWVSPTFNKRVAAPRVEARAAAVDGVPLVTAFWLADTPAPDVELRTHAAGTRLLVTAAAWRHELELRWQDTDKTANSLVRVAVS